MFFKEKIAKVLELENPLAKQSFKLSQQREVGRSAVS